MAIIAKEEQILAQPGDVFGIHYPKGASDGCVPYYDSGAPLCCGMNSSDLSRFHNAGLWALWCRISSAYLLSNLY